MKTHFNKVVIIGVGLMGASIGINLVRRKMAREVIGVGRNLANLKEALRKKAIHKMVRVQQAVSLLDGLSQSDLVILCSPIQSILEYLPKISRSVLVTDVGSTKFSIVQKANHLRLRFVGSHPIAGTEQTGARAGDFNLFHGGWCVLTPAKNASSSDTVQITALWKALGMRCVVMSAEKQDALFGILSHLPHVLAYSLMETVSRLVSLENLKFSFGSFKDTTRVASSSPEMWRDIFLENRKNVLRAISLYERDLGRLKKMILKKEGSLLLRFLSGVQKKRLAL